MILHFFLFGIVSDAIQITVQIRNQIDCVLKLMKKLFETTRKQRNQNIANLHFL
jgi:hypothetical protein